MEHDAPTDDGKLLTALGNEDWRIRRHAVDRLVEQGVSDGDVRHLLDIVRETHRDLSRLNGALQVLAHTGADVVPALIRLLAEPDHELRCYVALVLGERGDPRAVPALIELLADPDTNVRVHTIEALGLLRAADAVEPLLTFVASRDFAVAFPALTALGFIGDSRVVPNLLPLMDEPLLRIAAVESLGRLGDRETIESLAQLLARPDAPVGVVAQALVRILDRETERFGELERTATEIRLAIGSPGEQAILAASARTSGDELRALVRLLGIKPSDEAASILMSFLSRPELRDAVAESLATQDSPSLAPLASMLPIADADTQCTICELLRRQREAVEFPALLSLLDADEPEVIVAALETIAAIGNAEAYPALKGLLMHKDKGVRHAAALAIIALNRPETAADFRSMSIDPSPLLRESAVKILGACDGVGSLDAILNRCADADERVRRAAVEHLPEFDEERVMSLLGKALHDDRSLVRQAAVQRLASRHFEQAKSLILDALRDADAWVRYVALRTLLQRAPESVTTEALTRFAEDPDGGQVRATAISALGERREGFSTLVALTNDADSDVAHAAIAALGAGRITEATPVLAQLLATGEPVRRVQSIQALVAAGPAEAVGLLQSAAADSNLAVSNAALSGLAKINSSEATAVLLQLSIDPKHRDACIRVLQASGDMAVPFVAQGLQSTNLDVRRSVVEVLCRLDTSRAIEAIRIAVDDPHPAVRFAARDALARFLLQPPSAARDGQSESRESEGRP